MIYVIKQMSSHARTHPPGGGGTGAMTMTEVYLTNKIGFKKKFFVKQV